MENSPAEPQESEGMIFSERVKRPIISGKASAAIVVACLALTSVLIIPLARRFPPWIDFEIVLVGWWLVWVVTLAILLYQGRLISDDHVHRGPRDWLASLRKPWPPEKKSSDWWPWWILSGPEGCLIVLGIILALIIILVGLWLLIEIVIPALAFVAYVLIRGMLARVTNDKHSCQDSFVRAMLWGSLWATVYILPFGLLVWFVHFVHMKFGPLPQ
jgi:4-hydroxybenzoate polyprenyltransferase